MNYETGKPSIKDYLIIVVFVLLASCRVDLASLEGVKQLFYSILSFGLFSGIAIWLVDRFREERFDNQLKDLLMEELKANLAFINEDIYLVYEHKEKKEEIKEYCYPVHKVFDSILHSNKAIIFPKDTLYHLFNFYRGVDTICNMFRRIKSFEEAANLGKGGNLLLRTLKDSRVMLKKIFTTLGKTQLYEELKLKGLRHSLKQLECTEYLQ